MTARGEHLTFGTVVGNAMVVTACLAHDRLEPCTSSNWRGLIRTIVAAAQSQAAGASFLLLLPAGFVDAARKDPLPVCRGVAEEVAGLVGSAPEGSTVCFGVDGLDGRVQLGAAATGHGLVALGRKFYPAPGEEIVAAESAFDMEQGYRRTFDFAGRSFYLSVCYDTFGLKKLGTPRAGVDGIVAMVHGFAAPGQPGSGAGYFARYGFAGASRAWGCPVYGAALFEGRVQDRWPTAVLWDQGGMDSKRWTFARNPLAAVRTHSLQHGEYEVCLNCFEQPGIRQALE